MITRDEIFNRIDIPFEPMECECWLWKTGIQAFGYGTICRQNAHRVVWELFNGKIPGTLFVLHKCDTPNCVNPKHLFLGTQSDNMLDASKKGRHPTEKLKILHQFEVDLIFSMRRNGYSFVDIAKKLNNRITRARCGQIFKGKTSYKETFSCEKP